MPKISVIIASYNHEKYVSRAIQSVLEQTYQDFEIIITDDGSQDKTVEKIKEFSDPRISLFTFEKNQGACTATINSLKKANGKYIAILNSDDIWLKNKLEKQVEFLDENHNIGAVFSYAEMVNEEGEDFTEENRPSFFNIFQQENRTKAEWLKRFFFEGNCLCHPSVLIRRECYEQIGFYDERFRQLPDFDFWIRLIKEYDIYIIPESFIKFRIRQDNQNASSPTIDNQIRNINEYYFILKSFFEGIDEDLFRQVFANEIVNASFRGNIEFTCEKAFVYLNAGKKHCLGKLLGLIAIEHLYALMADEAARQVLEQKYHFTFLSFSETLKTVDLMDLKKALLMEEQAKASAQNETLTTIVQIAPPKLGLLGKTLDLMNDIKMKVKTLFV